MGIAVDGHFGPTTKRYFQSYLSHQGYYNRTIDGDFGYYSVVALQQWLRHGNGYMNFYPASHYVIDGIAGTATWRGLFEALRFYGYGSGWSNENGMNYRLATMLQEFLNDKPYLFS